MKKLIVEPHLLWVMSDPHFGHRNIIKYCKRPFVSVDEMDEAIIRNCNKVVPHNGTLIIVGDFSFHKDKRRTNQIIYAIKGTKYIVLGNHDEYLDQEQLSKFAGAYDYLEVEVRDKDTPRGKQLIVMMHYPFRTWNKSHHGSWSLHGHCHGSLPDDPNLLSIDVGVDCHNYTPISYYQIKDLMKKKIFKPIDHHGDDRYKNP